MKKVVGSVKFYNRHILLATRVPYRKWPSRIELISPGFTDIKNTLIQITKANRTKQNLAEQQDNTVKLKLTAIDVATHGSTSPLSEPLSEGDVVVLPDNLVFRGPTDYSKLTLALQQLPLPSQSSENGSGPTDSSYKSQEHSSAPSPWDVGCTEVVSFQARCLLVCTHATRDSRCGKHGIPLLHKLQHLQRQRQLTSEHKAEQQPKSTESKSMASSLQEEQPAIHVWPCSHIGGHEFAGNVVVYPRGDCYGCLQVGEVSEENGAAAENTSAACAAWTSACAGVEQQDELIAAVLDSSSSCNTPNGKLSGLWRGRIGLTPVQQIQAACASSSIAN
mmetsp:Transcript_41809/g.82013  ORF Transcript_41809/g.82013 Transcript_41809/m.82013 type:complete len:334 (-) Transcript_41809:8-1009(-)